MRASSRQRTVVGGLLLSAALLLGVVGSGVTIAGAVGAPPSVLQFTVTAIGTTTAMLSGSLDPNGADTQAWFEYGMTTAYGSSTPAQDVGAATSPVTISANLSGLTPNFMYHFRLDARNANGLTVGPDDSFITGGQTPTTISTSTTTPPATGGHLTMMTVHDTRVGVALGGVSCPLVSTCWAFGEYLNGTRSSHLLIDRYQAGVWVPAPAPVLPASALGGADCTSAASCWAVGDAGTPTAPLAVHYNGRAWTSFRVPKPPGTSGDGLSGIDCTSAASCWAVGGIDGGTAQAAPLVEHWNGHAWSVVPSPGRSASSGLTAVSCRSADSCLATGFTHSNGAAVLHWNGRSWSRATAPSGTHGLFGLSCRWATACFASDGPMIFRLTGSVWRSVFSSASINSVSCSTPSRCWGVGGGIADGFPATAEYWNGTHWLNSTVQLPPAPESELNAVTCGARHACVAVGIQFPKGTRGVYSSRVLAEKTSAP